MARTIRTVAAIALLASVLANGRAPAAPNGCAWAMYGRDAGRSFSQSPACSSVDRDTVRTLRPKWVVPTADSVTASPAIVDGIVYVGSWDGTFYALDAETGSVHWTFTIDDTHEVAFGRIVSSAAVAPIRVPTSGETVTAVLFGGGATLYALRHSKTGPELLAKMDVDPRTFELREAQRDDPPEIEIESSPVVARMPDGEDRIFVGMDVHNRAGVGRTGMLSFTLEPNPEAGPSAPPYRFALAYKFDPETGLARPTLTDGSGEGHGCGGVWSSPTIVTAGAKPLVVFGTSNCEHPTDAESVIAIDAESGALRWRFRARGPNTLDDDFGATPNALRDGRVGAGGKDGVYYVLDAASGNVEHAVRTGQHGHVREQFAIGGIIGSPAVGRDIPLSPVLPALLRELVFATTAFPTPIGEPLDGPSPSLDGSLAHDPMRATSLHAIDPDSGRVRWRTPLSAPSYGAPAYTNGVVLVPVTFTARLAAFDAVTGLPLGSVPTFGAPSSTPVVVGDTVFLGTGTRETDAEFKAFGDEIEDLLAPAGAHPLSPLSSISAYEVLAAG